jgi:hypothetical protein
LENDATPVVPDKSLQPSEHRIDAMISNMISSVLHRVKATFDSIPSGRALHYDQMMNGRRRAIS